MFIKIVCCFLFVMATIEARGDGGRGNNNDKFKHFFSDYPKITPTTPNRGIQVRKGRGQAFFKKLNKNDLVPTTTLTTTTKSAEQIKKEIKLQKKKQDPKGFTDKLKKILNVEKEAKKMGKYIHSLLEDFRCDTNNDCSNSTCCFKEYPNKPGKCITKPNSINQKCSVMCGCKGEKEELECKKTKISQGNVRNPVIITMRCKKRELMEDILMKVREGKSSLKSDSNTWLSRKYRTHRIFV